MTKKILKIENLKKNKELKEKLNFYKRIHGVIDDRFSMITDQDTIRIYLLASLECTSRVYDLKKQLKKTTE
jgi:hypothetical protein